MAARPIESALCLMLLAGAANAASSSESLGIKLQDSSTGPSIVHMRVILDHSALKPGRVTLQAENQSKTQVHEVVVAVDDGAKELPFDAQHDRVNESRVRRLGEIADLAPGRQAS